MHDEAITSNQRAALSVLKPAAAKGFYLEALLELLGLE